VSRFLMLVDSSENWNIIAFVIGDYITLKNFLNMLKRVLQERRIHASRLTSEKKKKLISHLSSLNEYPFIAICIRTKFKKLMKDIRGSLYIPKDKARAMTLRHILLVVRRILVKKRIKISEIRVDREFSLFIRLISQVFGCNVIVEQDLTSLADVIAYLNKISMERNILVVEL